MTGLRNSGTAPPDRTSMFISAARGTRKHSIMMQADSLADKARRQMEGDSTEEETDAVARPEAPPVLPNHDVSVMPTVVENRRVVPAEEGVYAPFNGAGPKHDWGTGEEVEETKTAKPSAVSSIFPRSLTSTSSVRNRTSISASEPGMSVNTSTFDVGSSGGLEADDHSVGRLGRMYSYVSSSDERSGHSAIVQMFRKASQSFTHRQSHSSGHVPSHNRHESRSGPVSLGDRGKLTEEDEAMLSDSEADYDAFDNDSERMRTKLLSPNMPMFRWYSTYMLFALLTFVFYMPVRVAFFPRDRGTWSAIDLVWNVLFAVDLILRLNTGFVDGNTGTVVYDRRIIFERYAKGWLLVDFCAAFPFTFLPGLGPDSGDGRHELAYLFNVPKMFRLYELLTVAQENHRLHEGGFLAARTLLSVVVTAHLFGCGWYILATLQHTECDEVYREGLPEGIFLVSNGIEYDAEDYIASECPWIYRNDYVGLSLSRRYLGSVYWALTTLTTVGYGDLSARTVGEQIYSMAVQIVGVSWYGYIVGTWASVLNAFDRKDKEQRSKMREVVAFSKAAGLPPDLAKKVRQHFRFSLYRQDNWITFNENELVGDMPSALRADVVTFVQRQTIAEVPWLKGKDTAFLADVVVLLKPRLFMTGDVLYREGTHPEEMFFITGGRIVLKHKNHRVGHVGQGQMAGLIGLVSCDNHKLTAVVGHKEVHCFGLSGIHFMELMDSYPKEMQELMQHAKSLAQKVSAASSAARTDLMSNPIIAAMIGDLPYTSSSPMEWRTPTLGHSGKTLAERWTQRSIGESTPSQEERGGLPASWVSQQQLPQLQQQKQQQQQQGASDVEGNRMARAFSSPDASTPYTSSNEEMMREISGSGKAKTLTASVSAPAISSIRVEDAVSHEVSRRVSGIEQRLATVMERLEALVGADNGSAAGGGAAREPARGSGESKSLSQVEGKL